MKAFHNILYAFAIAPVFILCVVCLSVVLLFSKQAREKWFIDNGRK